MWQYGRTDAASWTAGHHFIPDGIDVNLQNVDKGTAFQMAVFKEHEELAKYLQGIVDVVRAGRAGRQSGGRVVIRAGLIKDLETVAAELKAALDSGKAVEEPAEAAKSA